MNGPLKISFCFFAVSLFAGSCNDDPKPALVGKWQVTSNKLKMLVYGQPINEYLYGQGMNDADIQDLLISLRFMVTVFDVSGTVLEFSSDGRYTAASDISSSVGRWQRKLDGTLVITFDSRPNEPVISSSPTITETELHMDAFVITNNDFGYPVEYYISYSCKRL